MDCQVCDLYLRTGDPSTWQGRVTPVGSREPDVPRTIEVNPGGTGSSIGGSPGPRARPRYARAVDAEHTDDGDGGGVDPHLHRALGLTDDERDEIEVILGRRPNPVELSLYGVMWS